MGFEDPKVPYSHLRLSSGRTASLPKKAFGPVDRGSRKRTRGGQQLPDSSLPTLVMAPSPEPSMPRLFDPEFRSGTLSEDNTPDWLQDRPTDRSRPEGHDPGRQRTDPIRTFDQAETRSPVRHWNRSNPKVRQASAGCTTLFGPTTAPKSRCDPRKAVSRRRRGASAEPAIRMPPDQSPATNPKIRCRGGDRREPGKTGPKANCRLVSRPGSRSPVDPKIIRFSANPRLRHPETTRSSADDRPFVVKPSGSNRSPIPKAQRTESRRARWCQPRRTDSTSEVSLSQDPRFRSPRHFPEGPYLDAGLPAFLRRRVLRRIRV